MQCIVTFLCRIISGLNWIIWCLVKWLSIPEPKIDERMQFHDAGTTASDTTADAKAKTTANHKIIKGIYSILGILDNKASALMRFDGVILAVIGLLVNLKKSTGPIEMSGLDQAIMLLTLGSILLCLLVVGIFWRFLELAFPANGTPDAGKEVHELKRVLHFRETCYQLAWLLAVVVTVLLAYRFIAHR